MFAKFHEDPVAISNLPKSSLNSCCAAAVHSLGGLIFCRFVGLSGVGVADALEEKLQELVDDSGVREGPAGVFG